MSNNQVEKDVRREISMTQVALLLLILLAVIIGGILFVVRAVPDQKTENIPATSNAKTAPDRVKASESPNTDTTPSTSGTGPGSDKSLLGQ